MASQERVMKVIDDDESETDHYSYGCSFDHQQPHRSQSLSRLSMCTNEYDQDHDHDHEQSFDEMKRSSMMLMSRLSIESFDADGELSDDGDLSSDSDKETHTCYSLPATPPRWPKNCGTFHSHLTPSRNSAAGGVRFLGDYASENETQKGVIKRKKMRKMNYRSRMLRSSSSNDGNYGYCKSSSFSGESNESGGGGVGNGGGGGGLMVITRPKGGKRALCMDMEEVKACRDLGFELEHEKMLEMNLSSLSLSGSATTTLDTSSGGSSPISNWRISGPGDDPREVKARLKVWAQAVALVSASRKTD